MLIQTLIAVAISVMVSMAMMATQSNQSRETRALAEKMSIVDLQRSVTAVLADPNNCKHLFDATNLLIPGANTVVGAAPSVAAPFPIPLKAIPFGPGTTALAIAGARVPTAVSNSLTILPNAPGLKGIEFDVTSMAPPAASLNVYFDQSKLVRPLANLSFPVAFTLTGSTVTGCTSTASDSSLCGDMGGTWDPASSTCNMGAKICSYTGGTWDGTTCNTVSPVSATCTSMGGTFDPVSGACTLGGCTGPAFSGCGQKTKPVKNSYGIIWQTYACFDGAMGNCVCTPGGWDTICPPPSGGPSGYVGGDGDGDGGDGGDGGGD